MNVESHRLGWFVLGCLLCWLASCDSSPSPTVTSSAPLTMTPTPSVTLSATATSRATPTPELTATPTAIPRPDIITHTVAPNETLGGIALLYGTTVEALMQVNDISDPRLLRAGQTLTVPLPTLTPTPSPTPTHDPSQPTPTPAPTQSVYTAQSGDTLSGIAAKYNMTVDDLMATNNLTNTFLRAGQTLVIPPPSPTPSVTPTPMPTVTPTPRLAYDAPVLLYPPNGATFTGDVSIVLNWTSVGALTNDQYYVLRLRAVNNGLGENVWLKTPSYRLAPNWRGAQVEWDVIVLQQTQLNPDGTREGKIQSPFSETRRFTWR